MYSYNEVRTKNVRVKYVRFKYDGTFVQNSGLC